MLSVTISMASTSIEAQQMPWMKHLAQDTYIKNALARKEHVVPVFFDLERAYDTTWRRVILFKLMKIGFKGHLPIFIQNFLSDIKLKGRIGNSISDQFLQYEGVPQGECFELLPVCPGNKLPAYMPSSTCGLFIVC